MNRVFVIDSTSLISYFKDIFNQGSRISRKALSIIDKAFNNQEYLLIFPTAVFIEIFHKWCSDDEMAAKIRYEIYDRIRNSDNMEIQPFDKEVLENFLLISDIEPDYNFDNHDKQILAAAITMNCTLITSDGNVICKHQIENKN